MRQHHKWEKDVPGFAQLIEWFTDPGELVIDPFSGGGTTGEAALQTNRQFFGAGLEWEPVLSLNEIISDVADEFGRQQVSADSIAQQSEGACAGDPRSLCGLVGRRVVEHR